MEAKSEKVQQEIDHIIECIHKNPSEELRNNVHSFARKVLNSGQGRPITDTLQDLKEKAISKVRLFIFRLETLTIKERLFNVKKLFKDFPIMALSFASQKL